MSHLVVGAQLLGVSSPSPLLDLSLLLRCWLQASWSAIFWATLLSITHILLPLECWDYNFASANLAFYMDSGEPSWACKCTVGIEMYPPYQANLFIAYLTMNCSMNQSFKVELSWFSPLLIPLVRYQSFNIWVLCGIFYIQIQTHKHTYA